MKDAASKSKEAGKSSETPRLSRSSKKLKTNSSTSSVQPNNHEDCTNVRNDKSLDHKHTTPPCGATEGDDIDTSTVNNELGNKVLQSSVMLLSKAIREKDLTFLSELLLKPLREQLDLTNELKPYICDKLCELLLEFIDQPLRIEALELIKQLCTKCTGLDKRLNALKVRTVDYGKLVYLKGKIDYLRYCKREGAVTHAETEIHELDIGK